MAGDPTRTAEPVSTRRMVLIVGALALGWVVLYVDRVLIFPLLPLVGEEFRLNDTLRGFLASAYFLFYVGMQIPSGILGDRLGLARVVLVMYLVIGVALIGMGLMSVSYLILLAFMALHGMGAGAYYAGSYGITITTVPPRRRGISSAVVSVGMAIGLAVGLSVAGPLAEAMGSWRTPFLVMAVPTLAVAALFFVIVRGTPSTRGGGGSASLGRTLRNRDFMMLSLAAFCALYGYWVLISWAPSFFLEQRGLSLARAGQFTAVVALAAIPGALFWGRLSDRLGRKRISVAVLTVAGVAIFAIGTVTSHAALLLALAAYGAVSSLAWNPVLVAWAGDLASARGEGMGTAIGVLNAFGVGSSIVGPALTGLISDLTGSLGTGFYVGSASLFVSAIICAFAVREARRDPVGTGREG